MAEPIKTLNPLGGEVTFSGEDVDIIAGMMANSIDWLIENDYFTPPFWSISGYIHRKMLDYTDD